jgi:hypothetical protein
MFKYLNVCLRWHYRNKRVGFMNYTINRLLTNSSCAHNHDLILIVSTHFGWIKKRKINPKWTKKTLKTLNLRWKCHVSWASLWQQALIQSFSSYVCSDRIIVVNRISVITLDPQGWQSYYCKLLSHFAGCAHQMVLVCNTIQANQFLI